MVRIVNMHEAKTQLSKLVDEEFVIARDGKPVARVTPIRETKKVPRLGFLPTGRVPDDFDDWGSDQISDMFGVP